MARLIPTLPQLAPDGALQRPLPKGSTASAGIDTQDSPADPAQQAAYAHAFKQWNDAVHAFHSRMLTTLSIGDVDPDDTRRLAETMKALQQAWQAACPVRLSGI